MTDGKRNVLRKLPTWRYNVIVQSPAGFEIK